MSGLQFGTAFMTTERNIYSTGNNIRAPHGAHLCNVLPAGMSGCFTRGSLVFVTPTYWPVSYDIERDVKLIKK